jgi:magnesium-protoporphyrin O-methyltransferase
MKGPARDERSRSACGPGCACTAGNQFGEREARTELKAYRRSGPSRTTGWLIEGLSAGGVEGLTVLDIGAGVGAVHQALLELGAEHAIDVEGSPAFVEVAREEAVRQGTLDRVQYEIADFVAIAPSLGRSDIVALDRVICCYSDMTALVTESVARAGRRYGLVYPRDPWWMRSAARVLNVLMRLFRQRTTAWIHRTAEVDGIVRAAGFAPRLHRSTLFWQVAVYERPAAPG